MTFLFIVLAIVGTERVQTSWYQGAGEPGPVLDWGAKYYASENITHAVEGQISLTSSGVNYGAWTKHIDICGDANSDDAITNADLIYLASYLFLGGPAPQPLSKGDMNGDCAVTASDLTYLALYLFSGGPEPQCCGLAD